MLHTSHAGMGLICLQIRLQRMFLLHLFDALEHLVRLIGLCEYNVALVEECTVGVYHLHPSVQLPHAVQ